MSDSTQIDAIARRAAARLTDIDPGLPDQVDRALMEDPLEQPAMRLLDPISLGALIVSIAALGWTIYHDLKQDHAAARLDRAAIAQRLTTQLQEAAIESARLPPQLTTEQHRRIITVIAAEIVASEVSS